MNELRLIRLAIALGKHGNFARAAESLSLTQPSLTRGIAELERALGVPLFDRTRKGAIPTAFGRVLLERGEVVLSRTHSVFFLRDRTLAPAARVFVDALRAVETEMRNAESSVNPGEAS